MKPIYLGVDIAGTRNTWVSALSSNDDGLEIVGEPHTATLQDIVEYCEENDVVAVAIDAQLTIALSEDNGFRTSDLHLRELLPANCQDWVASINSLMAVPIRGHLLADSLSPTVGTVLETHPRASLLFGLGEEFDEPIREYKRNNEVSREHVRTLWQQWAQRFDIVPDGAVSNDGALDSLVCATVAYLFHHEPATLCRLRHQVPHTTGRGPFYIIAPDTGCEVCHI
jgi:predicted nuclease with RNAse H fold